MKFNFFLNSLSIHQAPLIKKLSHQYDVEIFYVQSLSKERKKLGWLIPDFGNAKVSKLNIHDLPILSFRSSFNVNVFSGINAYKEINKCLNVIAPKSDSINIVQMESIDCVGFKGFLRKLKYKMLSYKYNKIVDFFLCQGSCLQYKNLGFENCHDFAYFLDRPFSFNETLNESAKFIYLGSISKNKRIIELVESIGSRNIHIDIYGGELDITIESLQSAIRDNPCINYKGVLRHDLVGGILKSYDYLILPSKAEGWGSVVAEALLAGVGVIVTSTAGIVNYLEPKPENGIYVKNFDFMDEVPQFLLGLAPLGVKERNSIIENAYSLTTEHGISLIKNITLDNGSFDKRSGV